MKRNFNISIPFLAALIFMVAIAMRFYNMAGWSLSNDELSALNRLQFGSFSDMIKHGVKLGDFHPAGVQVFLWFWVKLFGTGVWVVRLPFAIFGSLSVIMTYLIGKRWFGTTTALFAAATLSFLAYPVLYSQLARPYAPGLLFSLVSVWFWTRIVFDQKKSFVTYMWFSVFTALTAYTHHYAFLFVVIVGISGFLFLSREGLKYYLLASLAAALLYLPHAGIFIHQFGIGGVGGDEGWLDKPQPGWILGYLYYAFNHSVVIIALLVSILGFSIVGNLKRITRFQLLVIGWFFMLFFIGYYYSIWRNPILQYSILIFVFPFLLMFIFSFMDQQPDAKVKNGLIAFLIFGILHTVFISRFYEKQHFGEFKNVAAKIAEWNHKLGEANVSNTIVSNGPYYIHYYLDEIEPGIRFLQYDIEDGNDWLELARILDSVQTPYFVHAWTKPEPEVLRLMIQDKFPCVVEQVNYSGLSEVSLYARDSISGCLPQPVPVQTFENSFSGDSIWGSSSERLDSAMYFSSPFSYLMDSSQLYGPAFRRKVSALNGGRFRRIEVEVAVFSPGELNDVPIIVTLDQPGSGGYFWQSSRIENFAIPRKWSKAFFTAEFPAFRTGDDELTVYIANPNGGKFYLDDFRIRLYP